MPSDYVTVKLDFTNVYNTVRRDLILGNIAANTPEIYRFAFANTPVNTNWHMDHI